MLKKQILNESFLNKIFCISINKIFFGTENFTKKSIYKFNLDIKKINYIKDEIDSVTLVGKDKQRAFAIYIERRSSESNFFKKDYQKLN